MATPIGNLRDITLRALDVLAAADLVLAEDTRVTAKLLSAYGLSKRLERTITTNCVSVRGNRGQNGRGQRNLDAI